jgi:hypothetical protein
MKISGPVPVDGIDIVNPTYCGTTLASFSSTVATIKCVGLLRLLLAFLKSINKFPVIVRVWVPGS